MYEIFRTTRRIKTTADLLTKEGFRTRNGSPFKDNTVLRLLRDPLAKGERRVNYTKSHGKGKSWELKHSSEWIVIPVPALISEELWNECNQILDDLQSKHVRTGRRAIHLLTGYVRCHCGTNMYITHQSNRYACKTCNNRIAASDLDAIYHAQLKGILTHLDGAQYQTQLDTELSDAQRLLASMMHEREKLVIDMQHLVDLRFAKELEKEGFQELYKPKELRLMQIDETLPNIQGRIDHKKVQRLSADVMVSEAATLAEKWDGLEFAERRTIVETITNQIVIGADSVHIVFAHDPDFSSNSGHLLYTSKGSSKQST